MGWMNQIGSMLQGGSPEENFQKVSQVAPQQNIADALASVFRSNQTPPFAQMVAGMFGQSSPQQQSELVNHLGGDPSQQPSQEQVQQMAAQAEQHDPSIVERVSSFYAQHPTLVQGLGATALTMLVSHMHNNQQ